jgi:4-amino-4-deoxy-L-arabinose transferase-like glycosyltransferase
MRKASERLYLPLVAVAVAIRVAIALVPGNSVKTPWSGGGDMDAYVLLARNLVSGNGYTYAQMPTAFRMPGYPLFLAAMMGLFDSHFAIAARFLQFIAGLAAAYFCMKAAHILFGKTAGKISLLAALLFPTLLYFSGEILTEGLTSFFLALFLWTFADDMEHANWKTAAAMGCALGLGALVRANMAVLGLVALLGAWMARPTVNSRRQLAVIPLCAGLIFAPWVLRNWIVFGQPLLSTEGGAATLQSLVNPEARLMTGWDQRLRQTVGYVIPNELETNGPARLAIGSELDMNRRCWHASHEIWSEMSWGSRAHWVLVKWVTYWLSTDQLLNPGTVSRMNRVLHVAAVMFYWALLALASLGWWILRKTRPNVAVIVLGYAVLMTVLHTPFVMNSRIRAPLVDPLIAVLAGGGWTACQRENRLEEVSSVWEVSTPRSG